MMYFNKKYLLAFIILFLVEVMIALYVHDEFVRPYVGDALVVVLIYFFVRTFYQGSSLLLGVAVFAFACAVEVAQYFDVVTFLHLQDNHLARVVIGTSFSWWDIVAYFVGTLVVVLADIWFLGKMMVLKKGKVT